MPIVISALHFSWHDMTDCLARATTELGLDGVELSWQDDFARPHCTRADLDALVVLRRAGMGSTILLTHIWENLASMTPQAACEALLGWLECCTTTGVRGLVIHGGSYPDRREGVARTRRVLEAVLPRFERANVVLCLENHYAYDYHGLHELFSEPWEFLEVFSLQSLSLRFCFDTGHGNMTKNSAELIGTLAPWLEHVHLADNFGVDDDHAMFRQGTVEWDKVLDQLNEVGFKGTYCVEFSVFDDRAPFDACLRALPAHAAQVNTPLRG